MGVLKIGICGWGNIATGLFEELQKENNSNFQIKVIGARRDNNNCDPGDVLIERDIFDVLNHDIDVMIELIGGSDTARDLILSAINKGINVITANKAVIFEHGNEIFKNAQKKNVSVLFESSVCAGTPVIKIINQELAPNKITKIVGMLNGTSNFILSEMEKGADFESTLKFAQKEGYAEPDPSFDIEGMDAAHKIGILSALVFKSSLPSPKFHIEGITDIEGIDFKYADDLGYSIKHLALAKESLESVELRAHLALVKKDSYLANLKGVRNGIEIETDLIGKVHVAGSGAGRSSTSSGIISDLIHLMKTNKDKSQNLIENFSVNVIPMNKLSFKNYICLRTNFSENEIDLNAIKSILTLFNIDTEIIKFYDVKDDLNSIVIITENFFENIKSELSLSFDELEEIHSHKFIRIES